MMIPYASVRWPWIGLLVGAALIGQEFLLRYFGDGTGMAPSAYRVAVMTVFVASLALLTLPPRRSAYMLGAVVCAGLMAWALWLQYGEGLEPCPLCMFQRVAVITIGVLCLVGAIHNPARLGATIYSFLMMLVAGIGAGLAARQVWLQALPKDQVPACGMGISYMLETLPFMDVITKVLEGSGECAEKGWVFLGLSIAGWTLVFFITIFVAAITLIRHE